MEKTSVFREESLKRVESPEQLNEYIKVSRPGVWIFLMAVLILMISVIVWSVIGRLPKTLRLQGYTLKDGWVCCYEASDTGTKLEGCKVKIELPDGTLTSGKVESVSSIPYSAGEIQKFISHDWIAEHVITSNYSYQVLIRVEQNLPENILADVMVITDEVRPIQFILN